MELGPITPLELDDTKRLEELSRLIDWQATYNSHVADSRDFPYFMELTRLMLNLSRRLDALESDRPHRITDSNKYLHW